jgi:peptidoglycan/LPS O-acetylase OafA/YrhL
LFGELEKTHTIRLKDFYIRRILRIWPLYYMLVILGLCVLNSVPFLKIPVLSHRMYENMTLWTVLNVFLIIPNFTHFYIPYTDQRWSIIVEELFYLIQPGLVRIFRNRSILFIVLCLIVFSSEIVNGLIRFFRLDGHMSQNAIESIAEQLKYLGCIAVGCIFSTLYYRREGLSKRILFSRIVQAIVLLLLAYCVLISSYIKHYEGYVDLRLYCLLFSIVVVNAAQNPRTIYRLETPLLDFLGKISYGIYMYHMICIGIAFHIARAVTQDALAQDIINYTLSIVFTVLLSWISFRYFESFFLKLKPRLQSLVKPRIRDRNRPPANIL